MVTDTPRQSASQPLAAAAEILRLAADAGSLPQWEYPIPGPELRMGLPGAFKPLALHLAYGRIAGGLSMMGAMASTLESGGEVAVPTLARSSIEAFSVAAWLTEPGIDDAACDQRALDDLHVSLTEQRKTAEAMQRSHSETSSADELRDISAGLREVEEMAEQKRRWNASKHPSAATEKLIAGNRTEMSAQAWARISGRGGDEVIYRLLSGFAHVSLAHTMFWTDTGQGPSDMSPTAFIIATASATLEFRDLAVAGYANLSGQPWDSDTAADEMSALLAAQPGR